jgi:SAM-dependent methyltransferase
MCEYDKIAQAYQQDAEHRLDRKYIFIPTFQYYLRDIGGKTVLDIACGYGFFTRLLKKLNAASVTGIDFSPNMISLAKKYEEKERLGIEYFTGNAITLGKVGQYDLVFAGFLLNYASNIRELQNMCDSISINLQNNGVFWAFNASPFFPVTDGIKYDHKAEAIEPLGDGSKIRRTQYQNGKEIFSFHVFHYTPETYKAALTKAGFSSIEWLSFVRSPDADIQLGSGYWDEYVSPRFNISVLRCLKS